MTELRLGEEVTFVRAERPEPAALDSARRGDLSAVSDAEVILVTCVKTKREQPAAARDLYSSPLFTKQRAYAERSGLPWFILSAEHGLVAPDEWLAPYERHLPDTPSSYQRAWGLWVVERLELLTGPLEGRSVEIHAGQGYVEAVRAPFVAKGASLVEPLAGLAHGQRLAWYGATAADATTTVSRLESRSASADIESVCETLLSEAQAITPAEFMDTKGVALRSPGLYSWWVDAAGAGDLSAGLGHHVEPGLIYAGLAGATRWPSGKRSSNTLWSRISGMHLGGRHEFSTFRRSLGAIHAQRLGQATIDEERLSEWIFAHLRLLAVPHPDPDTLGHVEHEMLNRLNPPLNLSGVPETPVRSRLKELRQPFARRKGAP